MPQRHPAGQAGAFERVKLPGRSDPRLLRQQKPSGDPALDHRGGEPRLGSQEFLPIKPCAGHSLTSPAVSLDVQRLEAGGVASQIDAATPSQAVVDPRLGPEFGSPLPMEAVALGRQRGLGVRLIRQRCRRQDSGRGP